MARTGRPKKETSKTDIVSLRIRREDAEKLEYLTMKTDRSKTDILLNGLRMVYNLEQNKT